MDFKKLKNTKPQLENYFNTLNQRVFTLQEMREMFKTDIKNRIVKSVSFDALINFLCQESKLKRIELEFKVPIPRYIWGNPDIFEICANLKRNCYFSHYSAAFLNDLTEQIPKNVYVNFEQPLKSQGGELTQESIDRAFKNAARRSNNIASYGEFQITLLNGKNTGRKGVIKIMHAQTEIAVTNIERTLIDLAVRPAYSGGVFEVLKAYKNARDRVSVNKMKAYLKHINHIYPYHQAIGFYLEKAGYEESRLVLFDKEPKDFNFYLLNQMKDTNYSKRWRLYYPSSLD